MGTNSTILSGEVVEEISKLKHELDGEIVVYASYQLGRSLIEHDLVDEFRLASSRSFSVPACGCLARPAK